MSVRLTDLTRMPQIALPLGTLQASHESPGHKGLSAPVCCKGF
jgi:hypothetical protein